MSKMKFYLVIFLMLFPVIFLTAPATASGEASEEFIVVDGLYKVRIEASQWEFKVFDMNLAANEGYPDLSIVGDTIKQEFEVKHRVEFSEKGANVQFNLYSRDVQHGFSINELDVAVAMNRPEPGNEFGAATSVERTLPNDDVTYSSFCHIFCGLGHPDMKVKFVIGEGSFEAGPYVFYAAILINVGIFGMTLRSIITKLDSIPSE
ncbi:MAG: hypothetical protein ACXAE3_13110 [Candidatus Kariarchaeaceae archaeon]|jgi:heme/copper-type cytochrome/quinol oxidase subunit 2